jgi:dTDP-4-amino-4,6-dideoxygalactose transaminase
VMYLPVDPKMNEDSVESVVRLLRKIV